MDGLSQPITPRETVFRRRQARTRVVHLKKTKILRWKAAKKWILLSHGIESYVTENWIRSQIIKRNVRIVEGFGDILVKMKPVRENL